MSTQREVLLPRVLVQSNFSQEASSGLLHRYAQALPALNTLRQEARLHGGPVFRLAANSGTPPGPLAFAPRDRMDSSDWLTTCRLRRRSARPAPARPRPPAPRSPCSTSRRTRPRSRPRGIREMRGRACSRRSTGCSRPSTRTATAGSPLASCARRRVGRFAWMAQLDAAAAAAATAPSRSPSGARLRALARAATRRRATPRRARGPRAPTPRPPMRARGARALSRRARRERSRRNARSAAHRRRSGTKLAGRSISPHPPPSPKSPKTQAGDAEKQLLEALEGVERSRTRRRARWRARAAARASARRPRARPTRAAARASAAAIAGACGDDGRRVRALFARTPTRLLLDASELRPALGEKDAARRERSSPVPAPRPRRREPPRGGGAAAARQAGRELRPAPSPPPGSRSRWTPSRKTAR